MVFMTERLVEMRRLLKPTGSLYLHCDLTASHYIKVVMDGIFGYENFRNEIVWCYRKWAVANKQFSRNHDTIFLYSKADKNYFQIQYQERAKSTLKRFGNKKIVSAFDENGRRVPSQTLEEESKGVKMADW
jgi:adenine specific DNA methylase Mod